MIVRKIFFTDNIHKHMFSSSYSVKTNEGNAVELLVR